MCDVVVLEDNDLLRELLVEVLEGEGFEVAAFATPHEALGRMEAVPPCRMLATDLDLGVPGLDGFKVAERVRAAHTNLPILYVSGRPALMNGRRLGAFEDFIAKPFQAEAFLKKLHALGIAPNRPAGT